MKEFVRNVCKRQIKNISCDTENVKHRKISLLNWLRYRNYRFTRVRKNVKQKNVWVNRKFDDFPYRIDRHYKIPKIPASSSSSSVSMNFSDDDESNESNISFQQCKCKE